MFKPSPEQQIFDAIKRISVRSHRAELTSEVTLLNGRLSEANAVEPLMAGIDKMATVCSIELQSVSNAPSLHRFARSFVNGEPYDRFPSHLSMATFDTIKLYMGHG